MFWDSIYGLCQYLNIEKELIPAVWKVFLIFVITSVSDTIGLGKLRPSLVNVLKLAIFCPKVKSYYSQLILKIQK